jgi:pilus assembly protein CpaF
VTQVDVDLVDHVRTRLVAGGAPPTQASIGRVVRESGRVLDRAALAQLTGTLADELAGLGPLEELVRDPLVSDVLVNGPTEVWVDRGSGLVRVPTRFRDEPAVRQLAVRLAARAGRRLDDALPFVDARLADGIRLHAVLPPLAVRGTTISLRIPRRRRFGMADLVAAGSLDEDGARWLGAIVRARAAFLVTGGTGSGKTSVLGAMLGLVPPDERMVIVEDTSELQPDHPHVVSLESRPANVEGTGEVPLRALVRQALRMRPDRLVVGEVRGAEVVDMLAGFNTGHEGGCGTLHANSAGSVPDRMAALALAAGMTLPAVTAQMGAGLEVVVHLARRPDGRRVVAAVGVVQASRDAVQVCPALVRRGGVLCADSHHGVLAARVGWAR